MLTKTQDWSSRVSLGNMEIYREKFESIQAYFAPQFPEATRIGNQMITTILKRTNGHPAVQASSGQAVEREDEDRRGQAGSVSPST